MKVPYTAHSSWRDPDYAEASFHCDHCGAYMSQRDYSVVELRAGVCHACTTQAQIGAAGRRDLDELDAAFENARTATV